MDNKTVKNKTIILLAVATFLLLVLGGIIATAGVSGIGYLNTLTSPYYWCGMAIIAGGLLCLMKLIGLIRPTD